MPRWGARIINRATGSVQIDDLYSNMALISKTTQASGAPTGTGISSAVFTYTATDMPIIAFSCASAAFLAHVSRDPALNTWAFTITAITGPVNITCYEFGNPPVLGAGWGVRITRGGVVKYDSRHRYAKIITTLRGNVDLVGTPQNGAGPSTTLAGGRVYAVLIGSSPGRSVRFVQQQGGAQQGYIDSRYSYSFGVAINGNSITSQYIGTYFNSTFIPVPPAPHPGAPYDYQMSQYSWALLDVTGF